ncbi:hypothetical protein EHS25_001426 [Saitozyma podzolica]|uniref:Beta-glucosidase 1B n=1 Tax=Saitozyma podzolica TaxID=1890683 RepID=A0A427YGE5_9TREE|nr:hypothetical protein EHS25_001426 [Saitozyma podzolica]
MSPAQAILSDPTLKACLPSSFLYGAASASHQIEGCIDADGKGRNVWDEILKDKKGENGEDACNSYEMWREDVGLLKEYGCGTYRFSISWARIRPQGDKTDKVNEKGIAYYSDLIDALLEAGIQPCITIFHWDHPQALEDRYGSFSSPEIVDDFVNFARVLFERLGDRCKYWITINEPHIFTMLSSMTYMKDRWNKETDYAKLAKTLLLCHAKTVDLYRREFQPTQSGKIGITLNCDWAEPIDDSPAAKEAAQVTLDLVMGLYADPVYLGKFPDSLKSEFGEHAPSFTGEEWALVKGSSEFFGLNHYGTSYTTGERLDRATASPVEYAFGRTKRVYEKDGKLIGTKGENGHPYDVPWGFRKLLRYIHARYTGPLGLAIYVTENGFPVEGEGKLSIDEAVNDTLRQTYYAGYVEQLLRAVKEDGIDMGGYMAWSLLDNLEWVFGYGPRFGITVVERDNGFKRTPKKSAYLLRDVFRYALGGK